MRKIVPKYAAWLFALIFVLAFEANAAQYKPIVLDSNYSHDKWVTKPHDINKEFRAYEVSFDSNDNNVALGIPEWVAHEIKPHPAPLGKGPKRPSKWIADPDVNPVPTDDSYRSSNYDRGHMCQKYIAWRLGTNADWNTHTTLNACPQSPSFNRGIWKDLEDKTAAWADTSGESVWVICGPVFAKNKAIHWIGDSGEIPVAVPHGFYKIVVRESPGSNQPDVLAFLYPHHHLYKQAGPHDHVPYLVSVNRIEKLTGLDFLTALPNKIEKKVEKTIATSLW